MTSRRGFLKSGGLILFGIGVGGVPTFIARAADSNKILSPYKKKKIMVQDENDRKLYLLLNDAMGFSQEIQEQLNILEQSKEIKEE